MKTILAIIGFVMLTVAVIGYAFAQPVGKCYDPGAATGEFPRIRCTGGFMGDPMSGLLDDDDVASALGIPAVSAQYVLPVAGDPYVICTQGNQAFVECGAPGVVVTMLAGGYVLSVPAGTCRGPYRLTGPNCAYIGNAAIGVIEFHHIVP